MRKPSTWRINRALRVKMLKRRAWNNYYCWLCGLLIPIGRERYTDQGANRVNCHLNCYIDVVRDAERNPTLGIIRSHTLANKLKKALEDTPAEVLVEEKLWLSTQR